MVVGLILDEYGPEKKMVWEASIEVSKNASWTDLKIFHQCVFTKSYSMQNELRWQNCISVMANNSHKSRISPKRVQEVHAFLQYQI